MEEPLIWAATALLESQCVVWSVATLFAGYYAYRSVRIQLHHDAAQRAACNKGVCWSSCDVWLVHCVQDAIFNAVCCYVGWCALLLLAYVYTAWNFSEVSAGAGALTIFLVFIAVNGISGTLPHLIMLGRLFGGK